MSSRRAWLLGQPVAHSLSPALHNAAFAALRIEARYDAREVSAEGLGEAVEELRQPDCIGANVTAPHKQAVLQYMDDLSEEVRALGALNTIVNDGGRLLGFNTDARGFARWLQTAGIDPAGRPALVLGAGGAARAVVWALAAAGASSILVLNRTPSRAADLVAALGPHLRGTSIAAGPLEQAAALAPRPWPIVVNATSLGHHDAAPAVHPSCYSAASVAIELAYNPPVTRFMTAAQSAGARAENGSGMLLHQAALAFERWTGHAPPMAVFEAAIHQRVAA